MLWRPGHAVSTQRARQGTRALRAGAQGWWDSVPGCRPAYDPGAEPVVVQQASRPYSFTIRREEHPPQPTKAWKKPRDLGILLPWGEKALVVQ
ncbi:hypothetical protein NDU88_002605 [Pleurodeles waltl]|uniref:Uncharacterized protein n=1 Tax=Pleurodeles waltl TaxID=8319 RepID=A0AAV7VZS4_PLEWA|nr:hypothetical protein NDU88_002605 [Pleurodeles waltl]